MYPTYEYISSEILRRIVSRLLISVVHDRFLVEPVLWLLTSDGFGGAGNDAKFEIPDKSADAFCDEGVPIKLYDGRDLRAERRG